MSQFILDEQLDPRGVRLPLERRHKTQLLAELRPRERILDDRVPEILLTLPTPTFLTIDQDFWDRNLCHPNYCILYFALRDKEQKRLPGLLSRLLRLSEFRRRAERMGKVANVGPTGVGYWEFQETTLRVIPWPQTRRRRR